MQQDRITAGDSLNFLVQGGAYPASSGWALTYTLVPRVGGTVITISTAAESTDFRVAVAAATTAAWAAGQYTWFQRVDKAGERYKVAEGQVTIDPDPANLAAGFDGRSQARKALDDARAALAAFSPARKRYRIGDREMEFNSPADIIKLISYWERQVQAEDVLAGRAERVGRRIFTRI
jgi:hypothetical protein